jgi:hypothetical protein
MADLRARFDDADLIEAPDLWPSVGWRLAAGGPEFRLPPERRSHQVARKVLAVAAAIIVTVAIASLLARSFFDEPVPIDPGPSSIFKEAYGELTYLGPPEGESFPPPDTDQYQVFATDPATGETAPLHGLDIRAKPIAWSADGNQLLLGDGTVVHADGSLTDLRLRLRAGEALVGGSFSPDGTQVAYSRGDGFWVTDASGTSSPRRIVDEGYGAWWSPDGSVIAFTTQSNARGSAIETVRPDGSDRRVVLYFEDLGLTTPDPLAWSPDGTRIAFSASHGCCQGDYFHVGIVNADGTDPRLLTPQDGSAYPAWSPDGDRIAFVRGAHFYTMAPDGSDVTRLPGERSIPLPFSLIWNHGG